MGEKGIVQLSQMKSWRSERNRSGKIALKKIKPSKLSKRKEKKKLDREISRKRKGIWLSDRRRNRFFSEEV